MSIFLVLILFSCLILSIIIVNVSFSLLRTAFLAEQARAVVDGSSNGIIEVIKSCISNNEFLVVAFFISFVAIFVSLFLLLYLKYKHEQGEDE